MGVCHESSRWRCRTWAGRGTKRPPRWRWGQEWSRDHCRTSAALTEAGWSRPAAASTEKLFLVSSDVLIILTMVCDRTHSHQLLRWTHTRAAGLTVRRKALLLKSVRQCFCSLTVAGVSLTVLASMQMHSWPSLVLSSIPDTHTHTHVMFDSDTWILVSVICCRWRIHRETYWQRSLSLCPSESSFLRRENECGWFFLRNSNSTWKWL